MKNIRRLDISLTRRPASYRGPRSSEDWTDCFDELIRDLTELSSQWNNGVIKLLTTLPDGSDDPTVDAFVNGIDGRTVYVDSSVTVDSAVSTYWHTTQERPKVLKEALDDLYSYVADQITAIQADVVAASGGLTTDQKSQIGAHIFDATKTSSASSLDGKSERNRLNTTQLAKDLYGTGYYSLDNDGVANLTNSVRAMVGALLSAHGGNWDDDITLTHSGISLAQTDVGATAAPSDSFVGIPSDLEDDLNQIRTQIRTYGGGAAWTTAMPALYPGGADSLWELLNSTQGQGTPTATNPWGYRYDDIDGLVTIIDAIGDFVGQDIQTDNFPEYSSNHFVGDGDSLEASIGVLDNILNWAADPTEVHSGQHFRRLESALIGSGLTVTHNKGSWPQVEIIQISPDPLVSGQLPYTIRHTSLNEFILTLIDRNDFITPSGCISSGVVISLW